MDTIVHGLDDNERRQAYAADITYGTNNEFGFDYLRDNMKFSLDEYVQRDFHYAIVDEVDSILIDEARTPLIISGPAEESTQLYYTLEPGVQAAEEGYRTSPSTKRPGRSSLPRKASPTPKSWSICQISTTPGTSRSCTTSTPP